MLLMLTRYVEDIAYNEHGLPVRFVMGNGVVEEMKYDDVSI